MLALAPPSATPECAVRLSAQREDRRVQLFEVARHRI
jgi:hypothetical protein